MRSAKTPPPTERALVDTAADFTTAIRGYNRYDHVTVKADRGFLYVLVHDEPVARLKPLSRARYSLSFHHHSGRWESTPFVGDIIRMASVLTNEFGAYLESYDFSPAKRGSAH